MASSATIYNFEINLSDLTRGIYQQFSLQVAQHPSETLKYLLTRVMAYCLEYCEGLEFTKGLADADLPALWVRDLTGELTAWIEIGSPSAERLHRASKKVPRVVIYSYRTIAHVLSQLGEDHIHHSKEIMLHAIAPHFLSDLEPLINKRNVIDFSVSEGEIYLNIGGMSLVGQIESRALDG